MTDAPIDGTVLFLVSSLTVGGSEMKTVRLANTLAARGRHVVVAYLNSPDTLLRALDPEVESVNLQRSGNFSLAALARLVSLVRSRGARVIVAINLYASLYASLAALLCRRRPRCRVIAWVNTTEFGTAKEQAQMRLYRHVLRRVDMTLFGAEVQCRLWEARYQLSTSRGHCAVLYNGVDTNKFTPRAIEPAPRTELPPCRFLIGTVGRLWPEKAHVDLVRAVAALRAKGLDAGACIVGEGPERARIEAEIRRTGTEGIVRIVGERADVRPYLACMQVFVLSSIAVETFSNATLEAMAMGCPIVAARLGGMEEMLRFGGGLTYPPADVAALSERLFELLTDPALRERAGFEARQAVVTHFGWNQMVSDFEAHLRRLSRSGSSRTGLPAPLA